MKTIIQRFLQRFTQPPRTKTAATPVAPVATRTAPRQTSLAQITPTSTSPAPMPMPADEPAQWIEAICTVNDPSHALQWLAHVDAEADLASVVLRSRSADVRLQAVQRIRDESLLKRIADHVQHKDKSVYKHCQQALKTLAASRQRKAQIAALETKLQRLLASEPMPSGRLFALQQALAQLRPGDDLGECEQLLEQVRERASAEALRIGEINQALSRSDDIKAQFAGDTILQAQEIEVFRRQATALREQISQWPSWMASHKQGEKLKATLAEIEQGLNTASADIARTEECKRFLAAQATTSITKISTNAWAAMPKPSSQAARATLEAEWERLRAQQSRGTPQAPQRTAMNKAKAAPSFDRTTFVATLEEMEQAIEQGETLKARNLSRSLHAILGTAKLDPTLANRHRQAVKSLNRLRGWARWSGEHARTELLEAAEALLAEDVDLEYRRTTVPQLRAAWNHLNLQSPAAAAQRERFNALLDQAFQPVLVERAAHAARRAEIWAAHDTRLHEWESWVEQIVWEQADLLAIQKRWQSIRTERRALPSLQGPDARRSSRRFAALAAIIKTHIEPLCKTEIERRERLITAATQLQHTEDLNHALGQARTLQKRWRDEAAPVLLKRQISEPLWQRFRVAIDILYARRTEQRTAQSVAAEQERARRDQILDTFATAIAAADSANQIDEARTQFADDWATANAGQEGRSPAQGQVAELLDRADAKLKAFATLRQQTYFQHLADKAALAERLENVALAGIPDPLVVSEIEARWNDIPSISGGAERLLEARLHAASTATDERLQQGHEVRDMALLDLEIWLDIPTPSSLADVRRQRQLQLLQSGNNRQKTEEQLRAAVARWYATTARPDPVHQERMARIVQQLSQAQPISA